MIKIDGRHMMQAESAEQLFGPSGFLGKALDLDHPAVGWQKFRHAREDRMFVTFDIDLGNDRCALYPQEIVHGDGLYGDGSIYAGRIAVRVDSRPAAVVVRRHMESCRSCARADRFFNDLDALKHSVYQEVRSQLHRVERVCLEGDNALEQASCSHDHGVKGPVRPDVKEERRRISSDGFSRQKLEKVHLLPLPGTVHKQPLVDRISLIDEEQQPATAFDRETGSRPAGVAAHDAGRKPIKAADLFKTAGHRSHGAISRVVWAGA